MDVGVRNITVVDAKGTERIWIVLDAKGNERDALLLVNAEGGGDLSIYDDQGNQACLGVLGARPTLSLEEKSKVVFAQPAASR